MHRLQQRCVRKPLARCRGCGRRCRRTRRCSHVSVKFRRALGRWRLLAAAILALHVAEIISELNVSMISAFIVPLCNAVPPRVSFCKSQCLFVSDLTRAPGVAVQFSVLRRRHLFRGVSLFACAFSKNLLTSEMTILLCICCRFAAKNVGNVFARCGRERTVRAARRTRLAVKMYFEWPLVRERNCSTLLVVCPLQCARHHATESRQKFRLQRLDGEIIRCFKRTTSLRSASAKKVPILSRQYISYQ